MKLTSKLFDTIRIKPRREEKPAPVEHVCDWEGCELAGEYRAPKGARSEGQYHHFCLEHVRHYNTAFNFFAGMEKDELVQALGVFFTVATVALAFNLTAAGLLTAATALPGAVAMAASFAGMFIGQAVRTRMQPEVFRRWFLIAMFFLGLYLAGSALVKLHG